MSNIIMALAAAAREQAEAAERAEESAGIRWTHWRVLPDGQGFLASPDIEEVKAIPPGVYSIETDPGVYWTPMQERTDFVIRFPDGNTALVLEELEKFWVSGTWFRDHGLPYKRGILLWGPPGSGKSCTLTLIARDVVARGGVVILFDGVSATVAALRQLHAIQPETPAVVLMEDLDADLGQKGGNRESAILNMLDGVEQVSNVAFIATTNYPLNLGDRIINRPSRFDRRIKIGHPAAESRRLYLQGLMKKDDDVDAERIVQDSEGLSLAHMKELFVATAGLGADYDVTLRRLRGMRSKDEDKRHIDSDQELDELLAPTREPGGGNYL